MTGADLVVASNRGPVSFRYDDSGALVPVRGGGGLVSTLGPAVNGRDATWVAAAMSDADRSAAAQGTVEAEGFRLRLLSIEPNVYNGFYNGICNSTLWFAYHGLFDLPRWPQLADDWTVQWRSFVQVNEAFAEAIAEEAAPGATVLVHDLHLSLVGAHLQERRPDLRTAHFAHTPFCWPDGLDILPEAPRRLLLEGLSGHGACGFHSLRWERAFRACGLEFTGREPATFVSPAAADPSDVGLVAESDECARHGAALEDLAGDRALLVRVDRMELSKNILRGFAAFDLVLEHRPEWRERVVFGAFCYPSRQALREYSSYREECVAWADRINERWATADWTPVMLATDDDFARSVAALKRADALLVNPTRDGLNMVAKEMTLVNDRNGVLCLSSGAGAWDELGPFGAVEVPPFDVMATARALDTALSMPTDERAKRLASLRSVVLARTPEDWLDEQLAAAR